MLILCCSVFAITVIQIAIFISLVVLFSGLGFWIDFVWKALEARETRRGKG